jgi:hypothetical protein
VIGITEKKTPVNFTFRSYPKRQRGKAAIGAGTPNIDILYSGKKVGYIVFNDSYNSDLTRGIRASFKVKKENDTWEWRTINKQFQTDEEAKVFVNTYFKKLSTEIYVSKRKGVK